MLSEQTDYMLELDHSAIDNFGDRLSIFEDMQKLDQMLYHEDGTNLINESIDYEDKPDWQAGQDSTRINRRKQLKIYDKCLELNIKVNQIHNLIILIYCIGSPK